MRSDLNKQLCERERVGHSNHYRRVRRNKKFNTLGEEGEGLAQHESMTHRHVLTDNPKQFNENLKPLYGAVRKAVGRRWDDFYSELCKVFDKRSVINQHILQHLQDFVERNIIIRNGQLYVDSTYPLLIRAVKGSDVEYYVDPRDGIIKRNTYYRTNRQIVRARREQEARELAEVFVQVDEHNVLRKINDVWFHFVMKKIPNGKLTYTKPVGCDIFDSYGVKRTWGQLQDYERQRFGIRHFSGESVKDIFYDEVLFFDGKRVQVLHRGFNSKQRYGVLPQYYHASKKTASHAILKKAKVI